MIRALASPRTTTSATWLRAAVLVAAGVLGMMMLVANAQRGPLTAPTILEVLIGWSFTASGIFIGVHRPTNRLGSLMVVVGLVWIVGRSLQLVLHPVTFTAGIWLADLWSVTFAVFLLSFPTGRIVSTTDRAIVWVFVFVTVPLEFLWLLFWMPENGLNVLAVAADANAALVIDRLQRFTIGTGAVFLVLALARRWSHASGPVRRQMTPVLAGAVAILLGSSSNLLSIFGIELLPLGYLVLISLIAVPIAVLYVILRARMARGAVADLVVELGQTPTPARLRDALANALGDPTLQVAYWSARKNQFVDLAGEPVGLPAEGSGQALTMLERGGVREAAIIHDAILLDEPGLIASVASAMRLAVENDRLTAAVEDQLAEVRASRARIVAAGDAERQRVERDLHDGAQQRLVALTLALRLARSRLGDDADPSVRLSLEQASEEAKAALSELRALARGIYPQILTEAGLHAALESLAARLPVESSVEMKPTDRFPRAVEAVAYFVVSEALANVTKYANASLVRIQGGWQDGVLTIEVEDDGGGGADPGDGSGLRGLVDRLSAVDGTLDIVSPHGGGTRLIARIPTPAPTQAGAPQPAAPTR